MNDDLTKLATANTALERQNAALDTINHSLREEVDHLRAQRNKANAELEKVRELLEHVHHYAKGDLLRADIPDYNGMWVYLNVGKLREIATVFANNPKTFGAGE